MGKKLMILFGTETGNAEMLAEDAGSSATDAGFEVEVRGMDEIDVDEMCEVERLLIYCSTWGDGEQPDNAQDLFDAVSEADADAFAGMSYGVLALGDTAFDLFCESGKEWDAILEEKGAKRIAERMDCDTDFEDDAEFWTKTSLDAMQALD